MFCHFKKNSSGFTMLELMAAIFVLMVGVIGAVIAIQQVNAYIAQSTSRLTAAYLAQEGIEIVRNIRDTNWIAEFDWKHGLGEGNWQADYNDLVLSLYNPSEFLRTDSDGFYVYGGPLDELTKFRREIQISENLEEDYDYLTVTSTVYWREGVKNYELSVREDLYNWREQ